MRNVVLRVAIGIGASLYAAVTNAQNPGVSAVRLEPAAPSVSGGEIVRFALTVRRDPSATRQLLSFTLESSQDPVTRFATRSVEIAADQERTFIDIGTASTPIRTQVTITATLKAAPSIRAQGTLELVPALIKQVTLNQSSLSGTLGATIGVTVELKAAAPSGGITLYSGIRKTTPTISQKKPMPLTTALVAAGTRTATFQVRYDDLLDTFSDPSYSAVAFSAEFDAVVRTVEQFAALDPPPDGKWQPIPDRALPFTFVLNPLRVTAISAQPASLGAGAEAVGTVTVNAAAGNNERARVMATGSAIRVVALGASCQAAPAQIGEIALTAGALVHSFKICARPVSATTTVDVRFIMRSGESRVSVTVHP